MGIRTIIVSLLASLYLTSGIVLAAPPQGESDCRSCHGERGISSISIVPSLACQQEQYLINAMLAYRDGRRVDASMSAAMREMHIARIRELADYYSNEACLR